MANRTLRIKLFAYALLLSMTSAVYLHAQASPETHHLTLTNAVETVDAHNRRVFVANVGGDLPGVFTLALVIGPNGVVSGGEWALNVSYIKFGPADPDGDGDASESLVQLGVIKGSVSGGAAVLADDGLARELTAIQLNVTGATLHFAARQVGNGTVTGSSMNQQSASNATLTITY